MAKNKTLTFTKVMYITFVIGTIISLIIVYGNIDSNFAHKFVVSYAFLAFFMLLYIPLITIINLRKLKWKEIRKRGFRFIMLFISFIFISFLFDYIRKPIEPMLFQKLPQDFGLAFGISFMDIIFSKNKDDKEF